jgi:hypothetical protein
MLLCQSTLVDYYTGLPWALRWAEHQCTAYSPKSAEATPTTRILSCPGHWPSDEGKGSSRGVGQPWSRRDEPQNLKELRKAELQLKSPDIVWMEIGQPFTFLNLLSAVVVVVEICSEEAKLGDPLRSWKRENIAVTRRTPAAVAPPRLGLHGRRLCELHLEAIIPVDCNLIEHPRTELSVIFSASPQTKDSDMPPKSGGHLKQLHWSHMIAKLFLAYVTDGAVSSFLLGNN